MSETSITADTSAPSRFAWMWVVAPLAAAVALLWLAATDVDRTIENWFYDAAVGGFPLRHSVFLEVVLHYWTRDIVALVAALAFAGFLASFLVPAFRPQRRMLLFVGLAIALATGTVAAARLASDGHCPWDLVDYGGLLPYAKLLEPAAPGTRPGRCSPSGHASAGFSLLVFYFVGRARRSARLARAGLALGLTSGLVLGFGRMLQGAHFLTHILWSGVICWVVILGLYLLAARYGLLETPSGQAAAVPGTATPSLPPAAAPD